MSEEEGKDNFRISFKESKDFLEVESPNEASPFDGKLKRYAIFSHPLTQEEHLALHELWLRLDSRWYRRPWLWVKDNLNRLLGQ